jgi:hypothetical protein
VRHSLVLLLAIAAAPATACRNGDAPGRAPADDTAAVADTPAVRLDQELATRWFDTARGLAYLLQLYPELQDSLAFPPGEPAAVTAARYASLPRVRPVLEETGMSAEEYITVGYALIGALVAYDSLGDAGVAALRPGAERENIRFAGLRRYWLGERLLQVQRGGGLMPQPQ